MNEFADDNFKFDKNGRKLSKRIENIVGKGEIARYDQFLLSQQCFQKACFLGTCVGMGKTPPNSKGLQTTKNQIG